MVFFRKLIIQIRRQNHMLLTEDTNLDLIDMGLNTAKKLLNDFGMHFSNAMVHPFKLPGEAF